MTKGWGRWWTHGKVTRGIAGLPRCGARCVETPLPSASCSRPWQAHPHPFYVAIPGHAGNTHYKAPRPLALRTGHRRWGTALPRVARSTGKSRSTTPASELLSHVWGPIPLSSRHPQGRWLDSTLCSCLLGSRASRNGLRALNSLLRICCWGTQPKRTAFRGMFYRWEN